VKTGDFDYELPAAAIAQRPIEPRDAARLLLTDSLEDRQFSDLPEILRPADLLVVNRTRVRAARLRGTKQTGGAVELLLTRRRDEIHWEGLIKPARRIRAGTLLDLGGIRGEVKTDPDRGEVVVSLGVPGGDIEAAVADHGEIPLPPYIHTPLQDDSRYQTVFAHSLGSAAAPTAALHFTAELIAKLARRGVTITAVELDIGLDTFRPIATEAVKEHPMHREAWRVPDDAAAAVRACRSEGGRVIAVGTTVVRTLESAATVGRTVVAGGGDTDLFITPGYELQAVDCVLTNFHAPRTTLIVMIAALLGDRWREVYEHALATGYRFLSFGDSMLIEQPSNRP
jgi:S-adenosylmethionine:tRNA ribosyltransferase-isomerase